MLHLLVNLICELLYLGRFGVIMGEMGRGNDADALRREARCLLRSYSCLIL